MQEHSESKKETVDSRELYYRQVSSASADIKKAEDEPAQDVKMKNLGVGFLSLEVSDSECQQGR